MGCFDSVYFRCPKCDERIEVQSKAGECYMGSFDEDVVPVAIANDIQGNSVECGACSRSYVIETNNILSDVRMHLRRADR